MTLRLVFAAVNGQFAQEVESIKAPIAQAGAAAIKKAADYAKTRGRASIAAAGFSVRWQNALRVDVYPKGSAVSLRAAAHIYHRTPYAGVFEYGAAISRGGGLLWLPISGARLQKAGAKRLTVKDYIANIGPLHSINSPGKAPVLAGYVSGKAAMSGKALTAAKLRSGQLRKNAGKEVQSVPLFYGISRVNVRARFGVTKVIEEAQRNLPEYYIAALR